MDNLKFSHGGNIYEAKLSTKLNIIDFSANINPLGLTKAIKSELIKNNNKILHYPDPEAKALVKQIAKYWKINKANILVGNGSSELIYLIMHTLMPKKVFIPVPTFSEYERAANSIKAKIRFLKLKEQNGFALNIFDSQNSDIIFISNPNNPMGNLLLENQRLMGLSSKLIIIDEAFMDFLPNEKKHTFVWKATEDKRIIVLRSFTKFFAFPGLRLGYIIAHRQTINKLRSHQPPWSVNSLAQIAGSSILNEEEYIRATRRFIEKERDFLIGQLKKINRLKVYPSVTNFLLIKIERDSITSENLTKKLLQKGILVRDCSNFRNLSNRFIRIAVKKRNENQKLIKAIKKILR